MTKTHAIKNVNACFSEARKDVGRDKSLQEEKVRTVNDLEPGSDD